MKILGIHDGHTATVCNLLNGAITHLASEERFTNVKNQGGFPEKACEWAIKVMANGVDDYDAFAFPGRLIPINDISAYNRDRHKWYKLASRYLPSTLLANDYLSELYVKRNQIKREALDYYEGNLSRLGINKSKCHFVEHHECHAATAYYLDPKYSPARKVLILTLDGSGDGLSATVSIGFGGKLERIASIPTYHSIGILYSRMTAFLGMKPLEHEYKLMGMAPYAPDSLTEKSYHVLKKYFSLDESGLYFVNKSGVWGHELIRKFQKDLLMHRFDGICGGLQKLTEELCLQWISNWVKHTGISNIGLAGGVFMNVKLNMLINEHPVIDDVFFMPSCGDESIAAGAALMVEAQNSNYTFTPKPITNLYLGPEYSDNDIEKVLKNVNGISFKHCDKINDEMSERLANGNILARMNGRMEFGARALGNRSILANPKHFDIVNKLNKAIKMRDYWMPFAASILPSGADKYLKSSKAKYAPFMIVCFETTEKASEIRAGLHQGDYTCRPQIVDPNENPSYYDLLLKFESKTGISGLLNTSFNIHGYPMVNNPDQALWTLTNSGLDGLQMGNFFVTRTS